MSDGYVEIDASELIAAARLLGLQAKRTRPAMKAVANKLVAAVDENLETSGHGTFPPLAPSTIRRKARMGYGAKPLFATGKMAASNEPEYGDDFAAATNDDPKVGVHVSDGPRTHLPQRDFFAMLQSTYKECDDIVLRGILGEKV